LSIGGGNAACITDKCKHDNLIVGIVLGVIGGIVVLCFGCVGLLRCLRGKPLRSNTTFIKAAAYDNMVETEKKSIFQSGVWTSHYYQYGKWNGPCRQSLSFDAGEMKVKGTGSDNVGAFNIAGIYSTKTQRLGLTKTYKPRTGNLAENLGHTVMIQLYWNPSKTQFEGKWYVQTKKYCGEDKFELKPSNQQKSNIHSIV
jgi:hypothetical protein